MMISSPTWDAIPAMDIAIAVVFVVLVVVLVRAAKLLGANPYQQIRAHEDLSRGKFPPHTSMAEKQDMINLGGVSPAGRLAARLRTEAPLWRLSLLQAGALLLLSICPWITEALFPGAAGLGLIPILLFIPVAYLAGSMAVPWPGYEIGFSLAVFAQAYVCLACWRIRRAARNTGA
jgi:hypothetical protein